MEFEVIYTFSRHTIFILYYFLGGEGVLAHRIYPISIYHHCKPYLFPLPFPFPFPFLLPFSVFRFSLFLQSNTLPPFHHRESKIFLLEMDFKSSHKNSGVGVGRVGVGVGVGLGSAASSIPVTVQGVFLYLFLFNPHLPTRTRYKTPFSPFCKKLSSPPLSSPLLSSPNIHTPRCIFSPHFSSSSNHAPHTRLLILFSSLSLFSLRFTLYSRRLTFSGS